MKIRVLLGLALICTSSISSAQQVNISDAEVRRIMVDDTRFGGCAAVISPGPETVAATCADNWVTFDCFGNFASVGSTKSGARDKLAAAQLALVAGKQVIIRIDPDVTANGATCYAVTVQNMPNDVP